MRCYKCGQPMRLRIGFCSLCEGGEPFDDDPLTLATIPLTIEPEYAEVLTDAFWDRIERDR